MADDRRPRPPASESRWDDTWTWDTMPAELRAELERRSAEAMTGPRYTTEEVMAHTAEIFNQLIASKPDPA